jgi:hypothetical protein
VARVFRPEQTRGVADDDVVLVFVNSQTVLLETAYLSDQPVSARAEPGSENLISLVLAVTLRLGCVQNVDDVAVVRIVIAWFALHARCYALWTARRATGRIM